VRTNSPDNTRMSRRLRPALDAEIRGARRALKAPYWEATRTPVYCLVFLLPLVVAYELAAVSLRPEFDPQQRLVAQRLIRQLVAWLGTDRAWVPGAALLLTLVVWQLISRGSWQIRARVPLLMIVESLVLTLPLLVLGRMLQQTSGGAVVPGLWARVVLVLGAGIYEELVFRFYLVSALKRLLGDVCRVPKRAVAPTAIIAAALVFAGFHFYPLGAETFAWPVFLMLTGAGAYLALVFVLRGLGIATGCHVAYNLIVLLLPGG
jgi:membrane protease YdiL (CAAX protease family)